MFISSLSLCSDCHIVKKYKNQLYFVDVTHHLCYTPPDPRPNTAERPTFCSVQLKCLLIIKVDTSVLSNQYTNIIRARIKETSETN
jgi:hypothetical protein